MLGAGIACSFAPAMFRPTAEWPRIHAWLTNGAPQPPGLAEETPETIQAHAERIEAALDRIVMELANDRPDAILLLVSDNGRLFTGIQVPQFATFLGDELWGKGRFKEARGVFEEVALAKDFPAFLTLVAMKLID